MTTKKIDVFLNLPAPVRDVPVTLSVKKSDIITGDEILNMINEINAELRPKKAPKNTGYDSSGQFVELKPHPAIFKLPKS